MSTKNNPPTQYRPFTRFEIGMFILLLPFWIFGSLVLLLLVVFCVLILFPIVLLGGFVLEIIDKIFK